MQNNTFTGDSFVDFSIGYSLFKIPVGAVLIHDNVVIMPTEFSFLLAAAIAAVMVLSEKVIIKRPVEYSDTSHPVFRKTLAGFEYGR